MLPLLIELGATGRLCAYVDEIGAAESRLTIFNDGITQ
jgi:hypothetical protein